MAFIVTHASRSCRSGRLSDNRGTDASVLKPHSDGLSFHQELKLEPIVSRDSASAIQSWRQSQAEA